MGGVRSPSVYAICVEGFLSDGSYNLHGYNDVSNYLSDIGEAFIKPTVGSSSGNGCFVVDFQKGKDIISGKTVEETLKDLGKNFVIQERLKCHESISRIFPNSVNTFRIITYRWKGQIYTMPVIMRIGQGKSVVDNAHAGGMFIALDDNGVLHETAFTEFRDSYTSHPDTGIKFDGCKIDFFESVIKAAKKLHSVVPELGVYNWDFTIDENGNPVLIEVNTDFGGIWVLEMAHGKGVFGDRTPEVLSWLRKMKKTKKSQRRDYLFGEV